MSKDQAASVTLASALDARQHMDALCDLYDEVFSAPPFMWPENESAHHREMLDRLTLDPTFGIAVARAGNHIVGFAYGVGLKPDTKWWNGFRQPVAEAITQEWPGRTFALIDLAVQTGWRRQDLGRHLLDTLLSSRPEERTTLAVQPQSEESHAFYAAIGGWELIGRQDTPEYVSSQFDIYVADLAKP